jgi:uncharacterized membrane protein
MFLTIFVLYFIGKTIYDSVGVPLGDLMKTAATSFIAPEEELRDRGGFWKWFFKPGIAPLVGAVIGSIFIFIIGALVATLFGKRIYHLFEKVLSKLPVIRVVYPYAKQFTEFFFKEQKQMEFKAAVACPFPTEGMYCIGFPTSDGLRHIDEVTKKRMICVFLPTSPTPFTGFVVYVPREQIIPLPISVEEAMRIIISCGVVSPLHQSPTLMGGPAAPVTLPVPAALEAQLGGPPKP